MIHFACPGCGASYAVEDRKAGKASRCRKCAAQFLIPTPGPATAEPPPPGPPPEPGVEIVPCPGCQSRLTVAPADLGRNIECPHCRTIYAAVRPGALMPGMTPGTSSSAQIQLPPGPPPAPPPPADADPSARERNLWPEEALAMQDGQPPRRPRARGPRAVGGHRTVTGVGILSFAKMSAALSFVSGVLIALVNALFVLVVSVLGTSAAGGNGGAAGGVLGFGLLAVVCSLVLYPFVLAVCGFVGGAVWAVGYNVLAPMIGGVEIDLE